MDKTSNVSVMALAYLQAGLSVIPTGTDKRPTLESWSDFQKSLPSEQQVKSWFSNGTRNIALINGAVSGNRETLDFDCDMEALPAWEKIVQEETPELLEKLYFETSPHGAHVIYRCAPEVKVPGNMKLAMKLIEVSGPGEHPHPYKPDQQLRAFKHQGKWIIAPDMIETRGTGGYCLIAPSQGYKAVQGDLCKLPLLNEDERDLLIEVAGSLNEVIPEPKDHHSPSSFQGENLSPGKDFDERGDIRSLLEKHGWTSKGFTNDNREKWARPGKERGKAHSATLTDGKIFYVFSQNGQPFEAGQGYGPFGVYAVLEHNGDFSAASKALEVQGYGTQTKTGLSMADLKLYMDMNISPGQSFTSKNICDGLGAYRREEKKTVYTYLSRLAAEGIIKKDKYLHGGFRKPLEISGYDLGGNIQTTKAFGARLPLDLHNLIHIEPNHLMVIAGRYDAGKSSFLWHTMALNYEHHKIVHFSSPEWSIDAIKRRMDELHIPRPHPNVMAYPMEPGYEDLIPHEPCIVLVDYLRPVNEFADIDKQLYRIFENLRGGVCFAAVQKHPGIDRPVGGQFSTHAPHHVILLDKAKEGYLCKILKSKSERNLEGLFRFFDFNKDRRLTPRMDDWKKGDIQWDKPKERKQRQ